MGVAAREGAKARACRSSCALVCTRTRARQRGARASDLKGADATVERRLLIDLVGEQAAEIHAAHLPRTPKFGQPCIASPLRRGPPQQERCPTSHCLRLNERARRDRAMPSPSCDKEKARERGEAAGAEPMYEARATQAAPPSPVSQPASPFPRGSRPRPPRP
eukprot:863593-Pleurochrysis_carterae.AAC.1